MSPSTDSGSLTNYIVTESRPKRTGFLPNFLMMPKVAEFVYPCSQQSLLILHSDGLAAQWNLNHYPGLGARHPALIAAVLYRDFKRTRDDITVIVAKMREAA